jgi:GTPase SAR1 family protein
MAPPMYGQVVVGPPGSGKTTYCDGMQQYLRLLGRDAWVINLDPANEIAASRGVNASSKDGGGNGNDSGDTSNQQLPYETLFDVCEEVVNLSSVMEKLNLGPNGGLIYCMEYLEAHVDEIIATIQSRLPSEKTYLLLDLPGQIELYTHSTCVQKLLQKLVSVLDLRLTAVQLIDAHYCSDAEKFLSAALLGTTTMLRLELPTVSVLSKVDLLSNYGELPMNLDFFTECHDLQRLVPFLQDREQHEGYSGTSDLNSEEDYDFIMSDPDYQKARRRTRDSAFARRHGKLHEALAEVVEDFGLLSFLLLDISSAESVGRVLARIDKSNGYVFTEGSINEDLFQCAIQQDSAYESVADVQERLAGSREVKREGKR